MDRINTNGLIIWYIILSISTYNLIDYMYNKIIYMYNESPHLPTCGWIQSCLCCDMATGNTYNFAIGYLCMYNVSAYMCKACMMSKKKRSIVLKEAPNFFRRQLIRTHSQTFP
jgi:hypothetical protein